MPNTWEGLKFNPEFFTKEKALPSGGGGGSGGGPYGCSWWSECIVTYGSLSDASGSASGSY